MEKLMSVEDWQDGVDFMLRRKIMPIVDDMDHILASMPDPEDARVITAEDKLDSRLDELNRAARTLLDRPVSISGLFHYEDGDSSTGYDTEVDTVFGTITEANCYPLNGPESAKQVVFEVSSMSMTGEETRSYIRPEDIVDFEIFHLPYAGASLRELDQLIKGTLGHWSYQKGDEKVKVGLLVSLQDVIYTRLDEVYEKNGLSVVKLISKVDKARKEVSVETEILSEDASFQIVERQMKVVGHYIDTNVSAGYLRCVELDTGEELSVPFIQVFDIVQLED